MEEIKEKLHEQSNEIHLLKEIIVQGCKGIQNLSLRYQEKPPVSVNTAAEDEANKSEDAANSTDNQTAPDLPLPLPNIF